MKILYITTIGGTMVFFRSFVRELVEQGHTVDIACSQTEKVQDCYREWNCNIYPLSCSRSPMKKGNLTAIKQIRKLVAENHYNIVHCHTPIAAACTRIACRKARKNGTKVFYTAHGFHFYKGAPLKNWLVYYPVEKLCARWTDLLITINREDYALAQKKLKTKKIAHVSGVGFEVEKFTNTQVDRSAKRQEIGVPEDAFLLLSVGEVNENKNHQVVVRALAQLDNPNIHYAIAGKGSWDVKLVALAKELGVENQFHLLGYRSDVAELYRAADVCCFPSIREGLGLAALEGLSSGKPIIASKNRGAYEYVREGENGFFCPYNDAKAFAEAIYKLYSDGALMEKMQKEASKEVSKFDVHTINQVMHQLYDENK